MFVKFHITCMLILFLSCLSLNAQEKDKYNLSTDSLVNIHASNKRIYYATRIKERPKIDGKLNDACWTSGIWDGGFIQQQPLQGRPPSEETKIKVLYDENNLYVAIQCFESVPNGIRPILSRRDEFDGDMAGIALDSYNDKRTAFEFNVSAAGQKIDLVHLGDYQFDTNWDAVWDGKTQVNDSLWTAEIRIPFNQLRFAKKEEQVWGMHIWRWIDRIKEESQWKLIPIDAPAMVYLFGELRGITGINPKKTVELLPYSSFKYSPDSDLKNKTTSDFGLDGKLGISSDFTLDYTINPDFGQVEADPSVLNLNAYEVFYNEKRPFFLEGNSILNYEMGSDVLFYSRRIGHAPSYTPSVSEDESISMPENTSIINALKITGKSKKGLSLGVIQSFTAKENASIYSGNNKEKIPVEPFTNYLVGRIKQDLNKGNTVIGGMVTSVIRKIDDDHLNFLPESAFSAGLDFKHEWKKRKYFLDMKSFYSNVEGSENAIYRLQTNSVHYFQRSDASHLDLDNSITTLSGFGGDFSGGKRSGKFRAIGNFSWRSPGVDLNEIGYIKQADFIREKITLTYKVNKPKGILRDYYGEISQEKNWSYGGEKTGDLLNLHLFTRFTNLWLIHLDLSKGFKTFDTRELRGGPKLYKENLYDGLLFFQTNNVKDVMFAASANFAGRNDHNTLYQIYRLYLRWQISKNFKLTSDTKYYDMVDLHEYAGKAYRNDNSTEFMVGRINWKILETTFRSEYFITPELSVQYYANPYASIARYSEFRRVADAGNRNIAQRYSPVNLLQLENGYYYADEDSDNISDLRFANRDFNFRELRSNFVARWEYKPGSTFYFVWTHSRSKNETIYNDSILDSFGSIFDTKAQNVFMVKFNYWFSL